MEELEIFRDEMEKIVNELKEMEEKLKNPNIDTSSLKDKYQEKVQVAKEKQEDMVAYDKRAKATIAQRQRNLLVEHLEVELIGPPTLVGTGAGSDVLLRATHGGALADIAHPFSCLSPRHLRRGIECWFGSLRVTAGTGAHDPSIPRRTLYTGAICYLPPLKGNNRKPTDFPAYGAFFWELGIGRAAFSRTSQGS